MGMLMSRHREDRGLPEQPRPDREVSDQPRPRRRNRKAKAPEPVSPYADLTDEQLAEAYATNVGGEAEGREAQTAELVALDAEHDGQPDNG